MYAHTLFFRYNNNFDYIFLIFEERSNIQMKGNIDESFKKILQDKAKAGNLEQGRQSVGKMSPRSSVNSMFNFGRKEKSKMEICTFPI